MTDLRALHEAATPGPWEVEHDSFGAYIGRANLADSHYDSTAPHGIGTDAHMEDYERTDDNFALIAAARNALPFLLHVVDAAAEVVRMGNVRPFAPLARARLEDALAALDGADHD